MNAGLLTLLFFGLTLVFLAMGLPISFTLGSLAITFIYFVLGPNALGLVAGRAFGGMSDFIMLCIPLFVFMGMMLERSGIAEELYKMMHLWSGRLNGGLAAGTVLICMVFAAMSGLSATATVTMGLVALPAMLKRGYKKSIALGCISAGGAIGVLIPPSISMVIYGLVAQVSVGKLFAAGIIPGIILGSLFIIYILVRCALQPDIGPGLPPEERADWHEKFVSLRGTIYPVILILLVLGTIFGGIATPTEGAAMGAFGSVICAAINRKLSWKVIREASYQTIRVSAMAMWIYLGAMCFTTLYHAIGAPAFIEGLLLGVPGGNWTVLIAMQVIWIVLGCFLDALGIIMITVPIFAPIAAAMGFDLVWFGVVCIVNMEMAYLTPPFGFNLFYLKGVSPKDVTMADIYRSVIPFVLLQLTALVIVMLFPQLSLWLPKLLMG